MKSNNWGELGWNLGLCTFTLNYYYCLVIPANEALNFIMVILIKNGFQVDVEIGRYLRKMVSHTAPDGPYRSQKRIPIGLDTRLKRPKMFFGHFFRTQKRTRNVRGTPIQCRPLRILEMPAGSHHPITPNKLLDFERSPQIRALSGICGVICIWGGPLRDLGLQLSGVEEGGRGFGLDVTILEKNGGAFGAALCATWGSSCRGWRRGGGGGLQEEEEEEEEKKEKREEEEKSNNPNLNGGE